MSLGNRKMHTSPRTVVLAKETAEFMESFAEKPLVSVVIPTHNRAETLQQALDSVYRQDGIGDHFGIEVLVVDDASSDSTSEVAARYPGIHYLKQTDNVGAAAARNIGIKASSGKYIAFLDDDDQWLPHRLRIQVPVLEANAQVGVVYGQGYISGNGLSEVLWPDARWGLSGRVFESFLTQDTEDVFNIDTVLVRRQVFDQAGYFDEGLETMEHHDLMLRLAFYFPFEFLPGPVSRGHASNTGLFVTSIAVGSYEQSYLRVVEKAIAMLPDREEYVELRRKARTNAFSVIARIHWNYGFTDRITSLVLQTLQEHPWMIEEAAMFSNLCRQVRVLATDTTSPKAAILSFLTDLKSAVGGAGLKVNLRMNRLRADLMAEGAFALRRKGRILSSSNLLLDSALHDFSRLVFRVIRKLQT